MTAVPCAGRKAIMGSVREHLFSPQQDVCGNTIKHTHRIFTHWIISPSCQHTHKCSHWKQLFTPKQIKKGVNAGEGGSVIKKIRLPGKSFTALLVFKQQHESVCCPLFVQRQDRCVAFAVFLAYRGQKEKSHTVQDGWVKAQGWPQGLESGPCEQMVPGCHPRSH